jgi:hypothetical protein
MHAASPALAMQPPVSYLVDDYTSELAKFVPITCHGALPLGMTIALLFSPRADF